MSNAVPPLPPPPVAYAVAPDPRVDESHLSTLAICHYVWSGLLAVFSSFFVIHIVIGALIVSGRFPPRATGAPAMPPDALGGYFFMAMGSVFLILGWSLAIATLVAGRSLARRRRRTFIFVVAICNCLVMPLGTVLGVFTLVVMCRDSVRHRFAFEATARP